jgi:Acyl-CoA thioester hydrolase/BAAT N-terminal region
VSSHQLPPALVSMIGFLPWIVYWILVGNVSFTTSILVTLGVAVAVNAATYARTRSFKLFEAGAIAIFVALLIVSLVGEESFLERWIQPLSNLGILVLALATVAVGRPFTLEYARESVPREVQATAGFDYVNRLLTWVWIGAFAVMTLVSFIPPVVQGEATIRDGASTLSIVCYWVIPFSVLALAGIVTAKFPDWLVGSIDRQLAPAERAPRTPTPPAAPVGEARHGAVRLALSPAAAPLDASLDVSLEGAPPGADVTLDAVAADAFGTQWRSDLTLTADGAGRVSADAAALLWSMEPSSEEPVGIFAPAAEPFALTVRDQARDGVVECSAVRGAAPGVRRIAVSEGEVVGELHLPAGHSPHPGVLVLPGSEGGLDSQASLATLLAVHGYAALVQGYIGVEGLEDHVVAIPLERLAAGVRALAAAPKWTGRASGRWRSRRARRRSWPPRPRSPTSPCRPWCCSRRRA